MALALNNLKRVDMPLNKETIKKKSERSVKKKNLQVLGNSGSGQHQTNGDNRKNLKRVSQTNGENSRNQILYQESHERVKYLVGSPCKILGTILEMEQGRTSLNGPKNKKHMTMHKASHTRDDID